MKRIFIEREKCMACWTCRVVCINVHRREPGNFDDIPLFVFAGTESRNYVANTGKGFTPILCRHCDEPECLAACMSGALHKNPTSGHMAYDKERCGQCFMCVMSCPYGVPKPDSASRSEVIRCNFCKGYADGPSCAAACPTETLTVREVDS